MIIITIFHNSWDYSPISTDDRDAANKGNSQ